MVFIIGLDHSLHQYVFVGNEECVYDLKDEVRHLVAEESVKLIAEEFSMAVLKKVGVEKRTAQAINLLILLKAIYKPIKSTQEK